MSSSQTLEYADEVSSKMPSLRTYLARTRSLGFAAKSSTAGNSSLSESTVLVMGNPSADLDSFVSAVVTTYFHNISSTTQVPGRKTYIPLLNLPAVRSRDLWRLRPEFGVALRLALGETSTDVNQGKSGEQGKTPVLEELITLADIKEDTTSPLHQVFSTSDREQRDRKQPLFLVDHNAPSIPGISDALVSTRFELTACIDHHVDENVIPTTAEPRTITTGIGSCTSLVVQHLRDRGLWPSLDDSSSAQDRQSLRELATLALAPIVIDTSNLKATGDKCSDTDREAVRFLESFISGHKSSDPSPATTSSTTDFNRSDFHHVINTVKANSLDLLTMPEIFDRDYKAWTEQTATQGTEISIGISSLVKSLSWLIEHAGGVDPFLDAIEGFAMDENRRLGVFCMLTRTGDGRKEVVVLGFDEAVKGAADELERVGEELKLGQWDGNTELMHACEKRFGQCRIWYMGDTSKSRKQVAPLLRESVKKI
jgi:exopolyphosphatase